MRNFKTAIIFFLVTAAICSSCLAADHVRVLRTYKVFSSSLDKLLLDTRHIYIQVGHESDGFYLTGFGPVFTADVSITAGGSLPKVVEQWTDWFQSAEEIVIGSRDDNDKAKIKIKTKKSDKNSDPKELSEAEKKRRQKERDMKDSDLRRIQQMEESIEKFKLEVMQLILDVGPVIQDVRSREKLAIVFHVADKEFCDLYKTDTLQVQINIHDLKDMAALSVLEAGRKFDWNI